jgi:hypothetical protein
MSGVARRALSGAGIAKRSAGKGDAARFTELFGWDDLDFTELKRHGFRYRLQLDENRPARRFWKTHVSDRYSGEVHVAPADRDRVVAFLEERGIPLR